MVSLINNQVVPVPLNQIAGKLKAVPVDSDIIQTARQIGITFGE